MASRFALYFPDFVTHLILFVVPLFPPSSTYCSVSDLVKLQPSFGYMLQFGSDDYEIESHTQSEDGIRGFLNALYGGLTTDGRRAISATNGIDFDIVSHLVPSKLLTEEDLQYYTDTIRTGNTYRVLHQNFIDETPFLSNGGDKKVEVNCPTLFVRAMDDFAITSSMVDTMLPYIPHLTIKEVRSSHWIMIQRPQKVNEIVQTWLQEQGINQN
ncbi:unnamed protein product [Penicillium manginii]